MRVRQRVEPNWNASRLDRLRPEGMSRREWRSLGSIQRKAIILGWDDPAVRNQKQYTSGKGQTI